MNKYLLFLMLSLLPYSLTGCDDDDEVKLIDLNLFAGTWEVVDQGGQVLFERNCILDIAFSQVNEGIGGYQGYITTYFLTVAGNPIQDRVFAGSIREVDNYQPLLDVVYYGELDSDGTWDGNYYYKITKLTDTHMWWQVNANEDNSTIKFRRRNDLFSDIVL